MNQSAQDLYTMDNCFGEIIFNLSLKSKKQTQIPQNTFLSVQSNQDNSRQNILSHQIHYSKLFLPQADIVYNTFPFVHNGIAHPMQVHHSMRI